MASRSFNVGTVLVLLVGAFLVLSGIGQLTGATEGLGGFQHKMSKAFGGSGNSIDIVLAVISIVAGALLLLSRVVSLGSLEGILRVVIFIFWIVVMVFSLILGGNINAIDTLGWWIALVESAIILTVLWMMKE